MHYKEAVYSVCVAGLLNASDGRIAHPRYPIASLNNIDPLCHPMYRRLCYWRSFLEEITTSDYGEDIIYHHLVILDEDMQEFKPCDGCKLKPEHEAEYEEVLERYRYERALYEHGVRHGLEPSRLAGWLLRCTLLRMLLWEIRLR